MTFERLQLQGLVLIQLHTHPDTRGFFSVRFQESVFQENGLPHRFVQLNHSHSIPGVLRGLHYQKNPGQGKWVSVLRGRIWDVAVDIRPESKTFGQFFGIELSAKNLKSLWIPNGFAHGFCTLGEEPADVMYFVDSPYQPQEESGIFWKDPTLSIPWPIENPILSPKDAHLELFSKKRFS